jgi:UDP-N-acetyl-D-mannosaminuronate dehydrogenase
MTATLRLHSADRVTDQRLAAAGVVELGDVGLPIAVTLAETGHPRIGYDVSETRLADMDIENVRVDLVAANRARLTQQVAGQQCESAPAQQRTPQ